MADRDHGTVREGAVTGIIGATLVALWFLIVDLTKGRLFFTPTRLGRTMLSFFGARETPDNALFAVIAYTVFHYAAFIAVGILAVWIIHRSETAPSILVGFLILFVALQLGIFGFLAILADRSVFGDLAWYQIGLANLLAILGMGYYLHRSHPATRDRASTMLRGGE